LFTDLHDDSTMALRIVAAQLGAQVITIASGVGCNGDQVAALVAARLRLPVLDTIVVRRAAIALDMRVEDAMALDGLVPSPIVTALACTGLLGPSEEGHDAFREVHAIARLQVEIAQAIRDAAADGGVVVGRAGAMVLADHALALHVRLDAPFYARVRRLVAEHGVDAGRAASLIRRTDRAEARYVRRAHRVAIDDPRLYDLILDPSTQSCERVANSIVTAAQRRWADEPARAATDVVH
jgi:cytidylate kinase